MYIIILYYNILYYYYYYEKLYETLIIKSINFLILKHNDVHNLNKIKCYN
jgi:hypothetical protein